MIGNDHTKKNNEHRPDNGILDPDHNISTNEEIINDVTLPREIETGNNEIGSLIKNDVVDEKMEHDGIHQVKTQKTISQSIDEEEKDGNAGISDSYDGNMNDENGALCGYETCKRQSEKDGQHCIYHMPEKEKDRTGRWEECMDGFYELIDKGDSDFRGFILKNVDLRGRIIQQNLDFYDAVFNGRSEFSEPEPFRSEFKGQLSFSSSEFKGDVCFTKAIFQGILDFEITVFHDGVTFNLAKFINDTNFNITTFKGEVDFSEATFSRTCSFRNIRMGNANFRNARFMDRCKFSPKDEDRKTGTRTIHSADFSGAHFEKGGSFDYCIFNDGSFEDASIQHVSFRGVNLDNVKFEGAQMEFAYLTDAVWTAPEDRSPIKRFLDWFDVLDPRLIIREELEALEISPEEEEEKVVAFKEAENTYRRIKHSLANEGDYEKAGEFYIHEMRMKGNRYKYSRGPINRWNHFWNKLYAWTCGYGERPKRVFLNAFIVIILFSLVYFTFDGIIKDGEDDDYDPSLKESVYFSVVTFTTLGYGDYSPKSEFQLIAVLEAFIGAFTIALFVLVFGRKVMR